MMLEFSFFCQLVLAHEGAKLVNQCILKHVNVLSASVMSEAEKFE